MNTHLTPTPKCQHTGGALACTTSHLLYCLYLQGSHRNLETSRTKSTHTTFEREKSAVGPAHLFFHHSLALCYCRAHAPYGTHVLLACLACASLSLVCNETTSPCHTCLPRLRGSYSANTSRGQDTTLTCRVIVFQGCNEKSVFYCSATKYGCGGGRVWLRRGHGVIALCDSQELYVSRVVVLILSI